MLLEGVEDLNDDLDLAIVASIKMEGIDLMNAEGPPPSIPIIAIRPKPAITDKEFYKAMQKLKDRGNNAVPPKKSASAYILFGKEVSQ